LAPAAGAGVEEATFAAGVAGVADDFGATALLAAGGGSDIAWDGVERNLKEVSAPLEISRRKEEDGGR